MSYESLLNRRGTIQRRTVDSEETSTGHTIYGAYDDLYLGVKYRLEPVDQTEIESDKLTHISTHRLFLMQSQDIVTDDKFVDDVSSEYDVQSVQEIDNSTGAHHIECMVKLVT